MRVKRLRDGTWARIVTVIAANGISYLWYEPI